MSVIDAAAADGMMKKISELQAECARLRAERDEALAIVDTYANDVDALRPALPAFGKENGKSWHEAVRDVVRERDAARADVVAAAGVLMIDVPEPGTDMAKVMLANAAFRRERDNWAALCAATGEDLRVMRAELTNEREVAADVETDYGQEMDALRVALDAARAESRQLRHLLFLAHGNDEHYLYGDDGERQCNTCMIDFNVDSPAEIEQKITDYWNRKQYALKGAK